MGAQWSGRGVTVGTQEGEAWLAFEFDRPGWRIHCAGFCQGTVDFPTASGKEGLHLRATVYKPKGKGKSCGPKLGIQKTNPLCRCNEENFLW